MASVTSKSFPGLVSCVLNMPLACVDSIEFDGSVQLSASVQCDDPLQIDDSVRLGEDMARPLIGRQSAARIKLKRRVSLNQRTELPRRSELKRLMYNILHV